jgi:signal peptidase II
LEDKLRKYLRDYAFLYSIAGVIIILDQWTKWLVRERLAYTESWSPWEWLSPFARIVHWNNTGAAFGMFQGYALIFTVLAIGVSAAIMYYFPSIPVKDWVIRVALSMQLGGAVGNLIDRLMFGGKVTDFISVGSFAVFNVADASITVGVAILLLAVMYKEYQDKKKRTAEVVPQAGSDQNQPAATVSNETESQQ